MTAPAQAHRLDGLEPDNLLAFMALLGLLRALEAARPDWHPRAAWSVDEPPLRAVAVLAVPQTQAAVCAAASEGVQTLAKAHEFGGLAKLKLSQADARERLAAAAGDPARAAVWSALVSDAAIRRDADAVDRTPFCLLDVAQTSFLKNLAEVCGPEALPRRGRKRVALADAIGSALFSTWRRADDTPSFRWDPVEDSRHAHRWAAPTDVKQGVEHGANVLAALGLPALTAVPARRRGEVRLDVLGGAVQDGFSFAWPIWRDRASLAAIRGLLSHPRLREPGALDNLGVDHVRAARRFSPPNSKYANFSLGTVIERNAAAPAET